MLERTLENNERLDVYESLLSDRQRQVMTDYFRYDLSLNEIAEKMQVTKQAVSDNLRRGEIQMEHFEETLHVVEAGKRLRSHVKRAEELLAELESLELPEEAFEILQRLKEGLKEVTL